MTSFFNSARSGAKSTVPAGAASSSARPSCQSPSRTESEAETSREANRSFSVPSSSVFSLVLRATAAAAGLDDTHLRRARAAHQDIRRFSSVEFSKRFTMPLA